MLRIAAPRMRPAAAALSLVVALMPYVTGAWAQEPSDNTSAPKAVYPDVIIYQYFGIVGADRFAAELGARADEHEHLETGLLNLVKQPTATRELREAQKAAVELLANYRSSRVAPMFADRIDLCAPTSSVSGDAVLGYVRLSFPCESALEQLGADGARAIVDYVRTAGSDAKQLTPLKMDLFAIALIRNANRRVMRNGMPAIADEMARTNTLSLIETAEQVEGANIAALSTLKELVRRIDPMAYERPLIAKSRGSTAPQYFEDEIMKAHSLPRR